jgi:hypothetical protein
MDDIIRLALRRPIDPRARRRSALALLLACAAAFAAPTSAAHAQAAKDGKAAKAPKEPKQPKAETRVPPLFQSSAPLTMTFTTNLKQIRRDPAENPPWRWASVTYQDSANKAATMPIKARVRGIWRLKNCQFPPIRWDFSDKASKNTLFDDLEKPKLVNYCRDTDQFDQYILQEAQLYRVYQQLTPVSHRVRVVRMSYVDSASGKRDAERWAIIVEDPGQLANRNLAQITKVKGAGPADLDQEQLALAYLFQYFIGNLDFSFNGLHNTELLTAVDGRVLPVAYDFDYAGAVNTSYAVPPQNYNVPNVRTRKFMGYCEIAGEYPNALAKFIAKKEAIYALYADTVGKLMKPDVVKRTLEYFDDFYNDVRTPKDAERNIFSKCIRAR